MKMKAFFRMGSGKITWGTTLSDDEPRADMYLPAWLLVLGLLLTMFGLIAGIVFIALRASVLLIVLALCCLLLGVAALLCWKNQTIQMLPNDSFEYTTFLGNKKVYHFSQIKGINTSSDSTKLLMEGGKVHIESCAILTERLTQRIHKQLEKIYEDNQ